MIHILLTILKVIGIVLLVILSLILALILLVLFVPIRYRMLGNKTDKVIDGRVKVSWLFGLIAFVVLYREKTMNLQVRVLGINIMKLLRSDKKGKKTKNKKESDNLEFQSEQNEATKTSDATISDVEKSHNDSKSLQKDLDDQTDVKTEKISIITRIKNIIDRVKSAIEKIKLTIKNIYGKIMYWKDFISDQRVKDAIVFVKNHLIKILKHVMPKKIKGNLTYGFDDPCKTGQILAGVSVFYPVYYKSLTLCPDFSGPILDGNIDIRGRIYMGFFVKTALQIFFNKNIQFIIHTFRNKEES